MEKPDKRLSELLKIKPFLPLGIEVMGEEVGFSLLTL